MSYQEAYRSTLMMNFFALVLPIFILCLYLSWSNLHNVMYIILMCVGFSLLLVMSVFLVDPSYIPKPDMADVVRPHNTIFCNLF